MRTHKQKNQPTPKRPEPRRLTTQIKRGQHRLPYPLNRSIPELRFSGKWLRELGFEPGARYTIIPEPRRLTIQLVE